MASAKPTSGNGVGTVLFSRNDDENAANDIWDDTALIKAYDTAMAKMKGVDLSEQLEPDTECLNSQKHKNRNNKKKHKQKRAKRHWNVGDYCRAVFTEDGQTYTAVVVSLDDDQQTCRVRYLDYGNEEDQPVAELRHGRRHKNVSHSESGSVTSDVVNGPADGATGQQETSALDGAGQSHHHHHHTSSHRPPPSFSHNMPPPPPPGDYMKFPSSHPPFPYPPWAGSRPQSSMPFIPPPPPPPLCDNLDDQQDSEAMCSMLMSWYMSGYHTGYYQGLREGRKHSGQGLQSPYR